MRNEKTETRVFFRVCYIETLKIEMVFFLIREHNKTSKQAKTSNKKKNKMSSTQFNVSEAVKRSVQRGMQRGMENAASTLISDVTTKLAEKYDFDVDEAMRLLGAVSLTGTKSKPKVSKSKPSKSKQNNEKPKEKAFPLPWCGVILTDCCQAIKSANKLYVQCRHDKLDGGDFCRRCQTETDKNGGAPPYGVIQDRLQDDYKGKDGKKPINYGNFMKTRPEITRERALVEAAKLGWTINEEQFNIVEMKKGRKPKAKKGSNVSTYDTDTDEEKEDLFANKLSAIKDTGDSSDDSSDDDAAITTLATNKRKNDGAAEEETPLKKSKESTFNEVLETKRDDKEECQELEEDSMSESESDEECETTVSPFEHNGKQYLIDEEDTIYDTETHQPLGKYDRENDEIN